MSQQIKCIAVWALVLTHAKVLETETASLAHQRSKKEKENAKNA